ncbi:hypothetical protein, partial [Oenococcus oeni]
SLFLKLIELSKNFVAGKAIRIAKIIVAIGIATAPTIFRFTIQEISKVRKAAIATIKKLGLII